MSANADADRAIAGLNGTDFDGRALNLNEARLHNPSGDLAVAVSVAIIAGSPLD